MSVRYTEESRYAVFHAQFAASRSGSSAVDAEHLLLGLIRVSPDLLKRLNITEAFLYEQLRGDATKSTNSSNELSNMPLSDEGRLVLSFAKEEADRMGASHVGIEHILLGILRDKDCAAGRVLHKAGAKIDQFREELLDVPHQPRSVAAASQRAVEEMLGSIASESITNSDDVGESDGFEGFSERARRAVFFARYEASHFHSSFVETDHVLLGILREGIPRFELFMPSYESKEQLRIQIEEYTSVREKVSVSLGLPFSDECERSFINAKEEAALLGRDRIELEHLLLGLLREQRCHAASLLREGGAELERIRKGLAA